MEKTTGPKHTGNPGHNEINLRIIGIEESEDSQLKGTVNIFNKIIEENLPNKHGISKHTRKARSSFKIIFDHDACI